MANNLLDQVFGFKMFNLPVGTSVMLAAAMGIADGLADFLTAIGSAFLPGGLAGFAGLLGNTGVAALIENVPMVNRFLGPDLSDLVSVAALATGVEGLFQSFGLPGVQGGISRTIGMITSPVVKMLPAPRMAAASTQTQTQTGGYNIGAAAATTTSPRDDVDMTLLISRGGMQA